MTPPKRPPARRYTQAQELAWMRWFAAPRPDEAKLRALVEDTGLDWVALDGCGPFTWALRQRRGKAAPFVQMLIQQGFNPDEPASQLSPLFEACYQRDLKSCRLLLAAGADPDAGGRTHPLGQACIAQKDTSFVLALLAAGASIGPALCFNGLVVELGREVDDFRKFKPSARWEAIAHGLAALPGAWSAFAQQLHQWAQDNGAPSFVSEVGAWVATKEAGMLQEAVVIQPGVFKASLRRI